MIEELSFFLAYHPRYVHSHTVLSRIIYTGTGNLVYLTARITIELRLYN